MDEPELRQWMHHCVRVTIDPHPPPGFYMHFKAAAVGPISADACYRLIAHPDANGIYRANEACTHRKVLEDDGAGRMRVQVENVSRWHFWVFRGRMSGRLVVEQDQSAGSMRMQLAPEGPKTPGVKPAPVAALQVCMSVRPLAACLEEARAAGVLPPGLQTGGSLEGLCFYEMQQSMTPGGVPRMVAAAMRGFVRGQVQHAVEDVLIECFKIRQGQPTLGPYDARKEINPADEWCTPTSPSDDEGRSLPSPLHATRALVRAVRRSLDGGAAGGAAATLKAPMRAGA